MVFRVEGPLGMRYIPQAITARTDRRRDGVQVT